MAAPKDHSTARQLPSSTPLLILVLTAAALAETFPTLKLSTERNGEHVSTYVVCQTWGSSSLGNADLLRWLRALWGRLGKTASVSIIAENEQKSMSSMLASVGFALTRSYLKFACRMRQIRKILAYTCLPSLCLSVSPPLYHGMSF